MLEIPEALTVSRQLKETVSGRRIREVEAGRSPHGFAFFTDDPSIYPDLLEGKRIDDAFPNGGQVEVAAGGTRMVFNDGVNIRLYGPAAELPPKHQLRLTLDDDSSLLFTVQMYGGLHAFAEGSSDNFYYLAGKEKPHPLSKGFDRVWFERVVRSVRPALSVKALLATEQRIPGLGNGVLQDLLFEARVHPQSKVTALAEADFDNLFRSIKTTLQAMADGGGRDTEKDIFGNPGGYRTILSAKTLGDPCPVCGGAIIRKAFLGGNIYFCPVCQPLKK